MRFDTIVIGGGLAGLTAGVKLQQAGHKTAIVSAGQNALHFSSGSFELLSRTPDGKEVTEPLKALQHLGDSHPYSKIGAPKMKAYVAEVQPFFERCGIPLHGDPQRNSYRLTPTGSLMSAWLTAEDNALLRSKEEKIGDKALIVNLKGYIDFYASFLADGLEQRGVSCRVEQLELEEMARLRTSPSEMRSVNIARVVDRKEVLDAVLQGIQGLHQGEDTVILPQVFGFMDTAPLARIRESIPAKVLFVGTMPPSVPGMRIQMLLKRAFEAAGGTFLMGDRVVSAEMSEGRAVALKTDSLGDHRLFAGHFILATGGYFSKGLAASPDAVTEPLFGLDVDFAPVRSDWYDPDFFKPQRYMNFGVCTDARFRALKGGEAVPNLYVIGSVLGGAQALQLGCGGGVALLTGFSAADAILHQPAYVPAEPETSLFEEGLS